MVLPQVDEPGPPRTDRAIALRAGDVPGPDRFCPRLWRERLHDLPCSAAHSAAVGARSGDVDSLVQLGYLLVGHAGADVRAPNAEPTRPGLAEHLPAVRDDAVHADVLGPRHVPEEPRERVHAFGRPEPHLVVRESAQ